MISATTTRVVHTLYCIFFFFQAEDGIRDYKVTGVQTCALPISEPALAFLARHHRADRLADLVGSEHEVVLDLRLGQVEVRQLAVAYGFQAVAAEAVIDVRASAGLQADEVVRIVRRAVQAIAGLGGPAAQRSEQQDDN